MVDLAPEFVGTAQTTVGQGFVGTAQTAVGEGIIGTAQTDVGFLLPTLPGVSAVLNSGLNLWASSSIADAAQSLWERSSSLIFPPEDNEVQPGEAVQGTGEPGPKGSAVAPRPQEEVEAEFIQANGAPKKRDLKKAVPLLIAVGLVGGLAFYVARR